MNKKYGCIYCTTNTINGKKYIGQHKYGNPNFDKYYLGSGVVLRSAIKKYGRKNFEKEILCECDSAEELNNMEIYYIKLHNAVDSDNYYNLADGGNGSQGNHWRLNATETVKAIADKKKSEKMRGENNPFYGHKHTPQVIEKLSQSAKQRTAQNNPFYGHKHTEEYKEKARQRGKKMFSGVDNPFYGHRHSDLAKKRMHESALAITRAEGYINPSAKSVVLCNLVTGETNEFVSAKECYVFLKNKNMLITAYSNEIKLVRFRSYVANEKPFFYNQLKCYYKQ